MVGKSKKDEPNKIKKKLISFIIINATIISMLATIPLPALAEGESFSTISIGTYHSMVIKADGSLWGLGLELQW